MSRVTLAGLLAGRATARNAHRRYKMRRRPTEMELAVLVVMSQEHGEEAGHQLFAAREKNEARPNPLFKKDLVT